MTEPRGGSPPTTEVRPGRGMTEADTRKTGQDFKRVSTLDHVADEARLSHFQARVVQDALTEATAGYWLRRAEQFERAMHRAGDFPGLCSVEQIEANNRRLAVKAAACRNRASLCEVTDDDLDVIRTSFAAQRGGGVMVEIADDFVEQPELVDVEQAVADAAASRTWRPVDLAAVLDGTWSPPQPTVGRRSDGVGVFYPGKVHTVASESEAGKTFLALSASADELAAGNRVVYLDFEDSEGSVVGRLLAMQVDRDAIGDRFHYLRPGEPLGSGTNLDDLRELLTLGPTLAVLDGITEAMTLHGLDPLSNKDAATFGRVLPRRIAAHGPAVACLDHVTKARDGRGRYALGAVHKLNALDGAAYVLDNRSPFGIGLTGRSTIRVAKDRPGQLRRHALPSAGGLAWFGDLVLTSHAEDFAEVSVEPPTERDLDFRPTVLMTRVAEVLDQHGPLAKRRVELAVKGRAQSVRDALDYLVLDGYVTPDSPHQMLKPYPAGGGDE